ncbi:hypothetical protein C9374_000292 [Naegleria lovaniensis]|uniref:RWP-RK domain-containing protein n=1 Tax=Naegleria lovaniensis TaxID=51637 RepID=A0AA88KNX6_NAELO|nr:uncharacterized protein C9374_000292 [Naegleria lovaniensis]KAG2388853.1 hypothetical protein C9374_000292 [Naegleria lovaniensis]
MTRFAFRASAMEPSAADTNNTSDEMPTMDVTSPSSATSNVIDTTTTNNMNVHNIAVVDTTNNNNNTSDETSSKDDEPYTEDNSVEDEEEYLEDDDADSSKGKGKKKRKSHVETKHRKTFMSIDVIAMRSCLHLNQKEAAKKLNVSLSTLKRRFYEMRHELGCDKWPYPPHKPTSGTGKRKHAADSSDEDANMPSDEETNSDGEQEMITSYRAKTRRQSVSSALNKRRDSIQADYVSQPPLDDVTQDTNHSFHYDYKSANSYERNSKKLKATHTGFLSSSLPEPYGKQPSTSSTQHAPHQENPEFVFYKDSYEEQNSSDGDQSSSAPEMVSDDEYLQVAQRAAKATSASMVTKKKVTCDLNEITKKTQSLDNPREKEIYSGAILLMAFKQQQILSNTL